MQGSGLTFHKKYVSSGVPQGSVLGSLLSIAVNLYLLQNSLQIYHFFSPGNINSASNILNSGLKLPDYIPSPAKLFGSITEKC